MSNNSDVPQHISEQVTEFNKQLKSYSKIYSKLPQFIYQSKDIQSETLGYVYELNSKLEGLLRQIMEEELNGETFRRISHEQKPYCPCPYCKRNDDEEEEGYYDDGGEEEEDE
jgi:hypothetical protein